MILKRVEGASASLWEGVLKSIGVKVVSLMLTGMYGLMDIDLSPGGET
jgi:hypothetical protein